MYLDLFLWICWCSQQFWLLPGSQLTFSVQSRYVLLKAYFLSRCIYIDVFFSGFAGALSSFGFSQVPSLHFLSNVYRYVLLKAYLLSRCCFSEFAGALTSFGFSYVPSLFFLSKVDMSFLRLIFFLDVSRFVSLDLLLLSAVVASPRFPAYIFCLK